MSLFVWIKRLHKQYLLIPMPRKYLTIALSSQCADPYILCNAHAVSTRLWYHLRMKFRALFGSVWGAEQLVVFWLADMVHFYASVCPFPAIWGGCADLATPTTLLRKHSTHTHTNTHHDEHKDPDYRAALFPDLALCTTPTQTHTPPQYQLQKTYTLSMLAPTYWRNIRLCITSHRPLLSPEGVLDLSLTTPPSAVFCKALNQLSCFLKSPVSTPNYQYLPPTPLQSSKLASELNHLSPNYIFIHISLLTSNIAHELDQTSCNAEIMHL